MSHELHREMLEVKRLMLGLATKHDIKQLEVIMATVAEALASVQAKLDQLSKDQAEFSTDLQGVANLISQNTATIADLKAQIAALNNGPGQLSAADQPALDKIVATIDQADTQAKAANDAVKALVVPTVPTTPPTP